ncbi:MAG: DUF5666 domain-containing protein [Dehalococcoidia bacterium]|nr:hypothetical protein [Acidobacteriota bacterium]
MARRTTRRWILTTILFLAVPASAHPGHEHHVEGVIAKVRGQVFDVEDSGGRLTFAIVAATEVYMGTTKATPSSIKVGLRAEVDGVENDRGMIEAKLVRLAVR